jgi:hypothetical protein
MGTQDCRREEREHLGFAEAVLRHIEPVLVPLGFGRTEQSCYAVMYESAKVFLQVIHDPMSYGIGIEFWRLAEPSERCTLGGLLASAGEYRSFQSSTPDGVNTAIVEIADLLRRYGTEALTGDPRTYQRLVKDAEARSEAYTKEVVQQPIRTAAHAAWQKRDYAKVRELYESIDADLTPVERKRLDYAKSHSSGT